MGELSFCAAGHVFSEMWCLDSLSVSAERSVDDYCTASTPERLTVYHIWQPLIVFCLRINGYAMEGQHQECGPEYLGTWLGSGMHT